MKVIKFLIVLTFSGYIFASSPNEFESVTVGFKLTKPEEWQFITAEENIENLKKVKMNDTEFHQMMIKYSTAPLVALTKYPEPFDDLNPSFKVNIKPLAGLKGASSKQFLEAMASQFQKMFQDFQIDQEPTDIEVAGLKGSYMRIKYTMAIPDGRTFPTMSELWIIPRGEYFFMIGAGTRQDEKTGTRKEIKDILDTAVIQKSDI